MRDDLFGYLALLHVVDALGAEFGEAGVEVWEGFEGFIVCVRSGSGCGGEEVFFKGYYHFAFLLVC